MALDGSTLVFADSLDGQWKLYRKARDAESAQLIPGTENGVSPFLSADAQTLGFFTMDGALKKISLSGGAPITLVAQIEGVNRLAVWLDDGTIMYLANINTGVRIDADGREIRRYQFGEARTTTSVQGLVPLPGSRGLLAYGCQNNCSFRTYGAVMDLESGKKTELLTNLVAVEYSSTGHLLAIESNRRVTATPFDAKALTTTGASVTVLDGPVTKLYGVSTSGQLLYQVNPRADQAEQLHWVDRTGRVLSADSSWKAPLSSPAIAPDGRAIAVSTNAGNTAGKAIDLWLRTADVPAQRVRGASGSQWRPLWFNGGKSLAFVNRPSDSSATWQIMRAEGDGSAARSWLEAPLGVWEVEIAANNAWMVYRTNEPDDRYGVYVRRVDGDTTPRRILADLSQPMVFSLSPDGRWLAYVSDEGGAREVYVTSIPDGTTRRQVSRGGGEEPRFSRSGTELFFVSGGALTVVPVLPGLSFDVGAPRVLFPVEGYARAANRQQYDVAPGDDRFLMVKEPPAPPVPPVVMAEHWFTELRAKLKR